MHNNNNEEIEQRKEQAKKDHEEWLEKYQLRPGQWMLLGEGLVKVSPQEENYFETSTSKKILKVFYNFYEKMNILKKYRKNKRAYLLHSEPGMGKSSLIRHLCRHAIQKEGSCIIHVPGDVNFEFLNHIFLEEYQEDVKIVLLIIEDMGQKDYAHNRCYWNSSCLSFLDGQEGIFKVPTLVIATTNFPKDLGPQLTNRPGRFNQLIKVNPPTDEEVFELVEGFKGIKLNEGQKYALSGKGLTPDHCIEVIIRSDIDDISMAEAVNQILSEREGMMNWEDQ